MEFLIIVFIIIWIISSVSRNIKKNMKKEVSFDPWSFDSDSMRGDYKNAKEMIKAERDSVEKEEKPEVDQTTKKEDLQKAYSKTQMGEDYDFRSHKETDERIEPSVNLDGEEEEIITKDDGELKRDLKALLKGEKLPLGIVASEVLGPPRALRPYDRRRTK